MADIKQIPRFSLLWLLATAVAALLPHAQHLPLWMWLLVLLATGWRWLTHLGRLPYPGKVIKLVAVVLASLAVITAFERTLSLESATAFMIASAVLKVFEMRYQRDGYIVIFLSFFVLAVAFLFDQGILSALYGILCSWLLLTALVALHRNPLRADDVADGRRTASLAAKILLASIPMMLVLYLLFPRLAPLWSLNLHSSSAITGLSEEMSPGDIARLGQSDELAFRVTFNDGSLPPREQLYWRALVLDQYDGRSWKPAGLARTVKWHPAGRMLAEDDGNIDYDVIQEPSGQKWLYALRGMSAQQVYTGVSIDERLVSRREVHNRTRYRVISRPQLVIDGDFLPEPWRSVNLELPAEVNPQTRTKAAVLRQQSESAEAYLQSVMESFSREPFFYTLRPPILGDNDIDDFLFNTRRGFCAHYASAFTFMARSAGIPARVVVGYQGGKWNEEEQYLTVRQYDAHAWAEAWLEGQGWVRFDPTAMVAPERILYGLEQAVADEGSFLEEQGLTARALREIGWLNRLSLEFDSLNYYWQRWVLSYDGQRQKNFLQTVIGIQDYKRGLYFLGSSFGVFFLLATLWLWWRDRPQPRSAFIRAWGALQQRAKRLGLEPVAGEAPGQYLQRLSDVVAEECREDVMKFAGQLEITLYVESEPDMAALIRALKQLRRRLR